MYKLGLKANIPRLSAKRRLESALENGRQMSGKEIFQLTLAATEDIECARAAEHQYMWEMLRANRTPV